MSTLQAANVISSGTITAGSYQTSGITVLAGNSTVTQLQVNSANAVVANSTATLLTVGGTTTLTANTTGITSAGTITSGSTVADSTAIIRPLVSMTSVASTTGTSIDFTGIPSWVKRITVMFNGVSTSGASNLLIQLGTGATPTYTTTGYNGYGFLSTTYRSAFSTGFLISQVTAATTLSYATCTILNQTGNVWGESSILGAADTSVGTTQGCGYISLAAALTAVRITTVNGTDTFDAGTVNVMYE